MIARAIKRHCHGCKVNHAPPHATNLWLELEAVCDEGDKAFAERHPVFRVGGEEPASPVLLKRLQDLDLRASISVGGLLLEWKRHPE